MTGSAFHDPALVVAIALAAGMASHTLAHYLKVPGILLMLACGVLLGPDFAGLVFPGVLGPALGILTGFAVAVILFEGGMSLRLRRILRVQKAVRRLVLIGGAVTMAGGAVAARLLMRWSWQTSVLFGTLVMVTGPTVVNPLLKRLKVKRSVAVILEAEGVFIDAVGAVVATVALGAALSPSQGSPVLVFWHLVSRLGFGIFAGAIAGWLLARLISLRLIPEGTENVFVLCCVFALYQGANVVLEESGIAAVTMAGLMMGNIGTYAREDLAEFKEELSVMLIGMLFVLLAADVRLEQVKELGVNGILVVAALILLIRPFSVFVATAGLGIPFKERIFLSWIGPRGIVAAAVASLFASSLIEQGVPAGYTIRALVFLVIVLTVVWAGVTGPAAARMLGLRRPSRLGWLILGANDLARAFARLFKEDGQEVIAVDSNPDHCKAAEEDCTRVIYGSGLKPEVLSRAEIDIRLGAIAMTANDEVNYLFLQRVRKEARGLMLFSALKVKGTSLTEKMIHHEGASILFANPVDVDFWSHRIRNRKVVLQTWRKADGPNTTVKNNKDFSAKVSSKNVLWVAIKKNGGLMVPFGDAASISRGDIVFLFVFEPETGRVDSLLGQDGWEKAGPDTRFYSTSVCYLTDTDD